MRSCRVATVSACSPTGAEIADQPGVDQERCRRGPRPWRAAIRSTAHDRQRGTSTPWAGIPSTARNRWVSRAPPTIGFPTSRSARSRPAAGTIRPSTLLPAEDAIGAVSALQAFGDRMAPHLMMSEVRAIAADDLWMSPCYEEPRVAFHFSFKPDWACLEGPAAGTGGGPRTFRSASALGKALHDAAGHRAGSPQEARCLQEPSGDTRSRRQIPERASSTGISSRPAEQLEPSHLGPGRAGGGSHHR